MTDMSHAELTSVASTLVGNRLHGDVATVCDRTGYAAGATRYRHGLRSPLRRRECCNGAIMNLLGAAQVTASVVFGGHARLRWISHALVPVIVAVCFATWEGMPSLLSTLGTVLIAAGRTQTNPSNLRLLVLSGTPFWLLHDVMIGSPLVIADTLGIVLGLATLLSRACRRADKGVKVGCR
jgi:hypothetical protein